MKEETHMSDALPLGLLLALTGGILDAYTYLNRGQVFATAETGNLVLLGINCAMGQWRRAAYYLAECLAVAAAALIPQGGLDPLVNCMIAFISAMQVQTFRKFRGCACATTMCTGNLRSGVEALYFHLADNEPGALDRAGVYFGLILCFIAGAVVSGLLSPLLAGRTVLVALLPLSAAFLLMFR